jgi:hypothetical protein
MLGPKPDPEDANRLIESWSAEHELRLQILLLVLPGAIGLLLVVNGIGNGAYLQIGIGLLLIASTPFLARRLVRKSEFGSRDD